jgi:hypothetical protein
MGSRRRKEARSDLIRPKEESCDLGVVPMRPRIPTTLERTFDVNFTDPPSPKAAAELEVGWGCPC